MDKIISPSISADDTEYLSYATFFNILVAHKFFTLVIFPLMANLFLFMSKLQGEFSFQLTDVSALALLQLTKFAAFIVEQHEIDDLALPSH
jgi:hypothetical protein